MKKIILLLVLIISFAFSSFSQKSYYKATSFNIKSNNSSSWRGWESSNIFISIDPNKRHIEINSSEYQVIDYTQLTEHILSDRKILSASATDKKYNLMNIKFEFFYSGTTLLTIEYSDISYSYALIFIE